ncbi:MAG: FAD binding domain-containing protein, partial [Anaerolineales bacterium]
MSSLEYHRPGSLEEAVALLGRAQPLAGGTALTPRRRLLEAVIDLQDLDLADVARREGTIEVGSGVRLETLARSDAVPEILRQVAR